jgi:hypothetical protein
MIRTEVIPPLHMKLNAKAQALTLCFRYTLIKVPPRGR